MDENKHKSISKQYLKENERYFSLFLEENEQCRKTVSHFFKKMVSPALITRHYNWVLLSSSSLWFLFCGFSFIYFRVSTIQMAIVQCTIILWFVFTVPWACLHLVNAHAWWRPLNFLRDSAPKDIIYIEPRR